MFREGPGNWIYVQLLEAKARLKEDRGLAKVKSNTDKDMQRHRETVRSAGGVEGCDRH